MKLMTGLMLAAMMLNAGELRVPRDCATIEAALAIANKTAEPTTILIAPGDYTPKTMLRITTNNVKLVASNPNCRPRIFGPGAVKNWSQMSNNIWVASVTHIKKPNNVRLFFYNGKRMEPARYPNIDREHDPYRTGFAFADERGIKSLVKTHFYAATGLYNDEIQVRSEDQRQWAHPEDGWVIVAPRHNWWNKSYGIKAYSNGVFMVNTPHTEITQRNFVWDRWCVQNMREELDAPGEWYYDKREKKIYFITPDGSNPNSGTAVLSEEPCVIEARNVSGVELRGLEFANAYGGINLMNVRDTKVLGCSVHDIAFHWGEGIRLHQCERTEVRDCDVYNSGSHGISLSSDDAKKAQSIDYRSNNVVDNCYVHHCGEINSHGIGIYIAGNGVKITHNLVHDMPRCGMFGYGRFADIAYNRVRHVNTINDDTGAIYGGGWPVGTRVRYNWFSDSIGFQRNKEGKYVLYRGACGIYPDEGCGGLEVYGNLVENCHHVAMHLHNGRWITITNNVFINNSSLPCDKHCRQLSLQTWDNNPNGYFMKIRRAAIAKQYHEAFDADPRWQQFPAIKQAPDNDALAFNEDGTTMMGVEVKRNIFYYPDQSKSLAINCWQVNPKANPIDFNLYYSGTNITMGTSIGGGKWEGWQKAGQDINSIIADPLFRDFAHHDLRLKPESPAFKLGFVDLPYDQMGLRITPLRPKLPVIAPGLQEHPEWLK